MTLTGFPVTMLIDRGLVLRCIVAGEAELAVSILLVPHEAVAPILMDRSSHREQWGIQHCCD